MTSQMSARERIAGVVRDADVAGDDFTVATYLPHADRIIAIVREALRGMDVMEVAGEGCKGVSEMHPAAGWDVIAHYGIAAALSTAFGEETGDE